MRKLPTVHEVYRLFGLVIFAATFLVGSAKADFITSINQLQVDGTVNWNQFGPVFTIVGGGDWATVNGLPGTSVSVWGPQTGFGSSRRLDEGFGASGNFLPGTPLLHSIVGGGGLPEWRFEFLNSTTGSALPVAGFGLQYQFSPYSAFGVDLSVYTESGALLGTRNYTGISSGNPDGSAIFLGMTSQYQDIGYFTLTSTTQLSNFSNSSLVGPVYVQADPTPVSAVPAPPAAILLLTGLFPLAVMFRRRAFSYNRSSASSV